TEWIFPLGSTRNTLRSSRSTPQVTSNLPADSQPVGSKVVLFDLDNTLFDHFHSLRQGIRAVCAEYARLSERNEDELIEAYTVVSRFYCTNSIQTIIESGESTCLNLSDA